ncbi:hypothetical protein MKX03_020391 [Papaver bracteatum]|nr:hypothetical protein MKX03_020391 [Papaver bracteatum]
MASLLMYSSLVLVYVLFSSTEAADILVGGKPNSWKIPSSVSDSLNKWTGSTHFSIGDSLGKKLVVVVMLKFHNGIAPGPSPMGSTVAPSSGSHSLKTGSFLGALLVVALFFCAY